MDTNCNTTQNEQSGEDLLLKICRTSEAASVAIGTEDNPSAILKTAHGASVGDLVNFPTLPGSVTTVLPNTIYFVKEVLTSGSFTISSTIGGAALVFDAAIADFDLEIFSDVGGLRSSGLAMSAEGVDVTNHGSGKWRKFKDGAGIKQGSISGSGVIVNESNYLLLDSQFRLNKLTCLAFCNVATGRIQYGCFMIVSLEETGEFNGEATYSMSAESSGEVKVKAAA